MRPTTIATSLYIEIINAGLTAAILRFPIDKLYLMQGASILWKHANERLLSM